jgi:hypothetical protein
LLPTTPSKASFTSVKEIALGPIQRRLQFRAGAFGFRFLRR